MRGGSGAGAGRGDFSPDIRRGVETGGGALRETRGAGPARPLHPARIFPMFALTIRDAAVARAGGRFVLRSIRRASQTNSYFARGGAACAEGAVTPKPDFLELAILGKIQSSWIICRVVEGAEPDKVARCRLGGEEGDPK